MIVGRPSPRGLGADYAERVRVRGFVHYGANPNVVLADGGAVMRLGVSATHVTYLGAVAQP